MRCSPTLLHFSFFLSCARRPVRASAQPVRPPAGRLLARRPGLQGGRDDWERDQTTRRPALPARPRSQDVQNALRTGVLGGPCVYCRKSRSPQHGAASRRCGVVPTRRAGAQPPGPPTYPTYHPLPLRPAGGRRGRSSPHQSDCPRAYRPEPVPFQQAVIRRHRS